MTENDTFARSVALDRALQWAKDHASNPGDYVHSDKVIEVAEKFRAFLAGDTQVATPVAEPGFPIFKLPRTNDGYLYFRFKKTPILYRSDLSFGSMAGGVSRISARHQTEWVDLGSGPEFSRHALWNRSTVEVITADLATRVLREYVKDVQFE